MKIGKILLGILLLFGIGKEYAQASRDLGTFVSPGIIIAVLLFLFLCTWLIGSGFSKRKLEFKSFEFLKFFIITFVAFALISFFSLISSVVPKDFVEINGVKIPLSVCMNDSRKIILDQNERKDYCLCIAEKITSDSILKTEYKKDLENGKLNDVFMELQKNNEPIILDLENCVINIGIKWTDNLANSFRTVIKNDIEGTEFEETNNIDDYCDCLTSEYRKLPYNTIFKDGFNESEIGLSIDSLCTEKSKK